MTNFECKPVSGQAVPGQAVPGQAVPCQAVPGQVGPDLSNTGRVDCGKHLYLAFSNFVESKTFCRHHPKIFYFHIC